MCGIVASLDWSGNSALHQIGCGLGMLRHRGPDGTGSWRSAEGHVCLGHVRLSVVDLVSGDQPLANETGQIHIVVNGEFYGFEEIREELETRGHRFRSRSDSEILLHLYEEFGTDCIHRLRGEYAFVLWDEREKLLLAARDRFGIKPLFFSEFRGRLLFASEMKALHAAGIAAEWEEQGVFEKLVLDFPLRGRTLFRGISELPPAHSLIARNGSYAIHRYWDFDYARGQENSLVCCDEEYADRLKATIDQAIRMRMRADVPVACYLSGGIDSGSVLGLMSRAGSTPVQAFCLTFEDTTCDELSLARDTAQFLNARLSSVPVTQSSIAAHIRDAVWHGETLFTNAHCVAKFILSAAAHKAGYKVVLTGEGADEIFAGYPVFVIDSLRHGTAEERHALEQLSQESEWKRRFQAADEGERLRNIRDRLGYVPAWYESRELLLNPLREVLPDYFESEAIQAQLLDDAGVEAQLRDRAILDKSLYLYNRTSLAGHILTVMGDRMEMAHSIEARLPFLDHHLVEFSRCLPPSQKVRGFAEKFVLRKAMRTVVPPAVCGRRKHPLRAPPTLLEPGPLHDLVQDTLRGSAMGSVPFVKREAVIRLLDRALQGDHVDKTVLDSPLLALFTAAVLSERFHL